MFINHIAPQPARDPDKQISMGQTAEQQFLVKVWFPAAGIVFFTELIYVARPDISRHWNISQVFSGADIDGHQAWGAQ